MKPQDSCLRTLWWGEKMLAPNDGACVLLWRGGLCCGGSLLRLGFQWCVGF